MSNPSIPGPYRVVEEKHDNGRYIIRSDPRGGGDVPGDLVVATVVGGGPEEYELGTAQLLAQAPEMKDLLRSACAIAERKGEGTAWDRFLASAAKLGVNGVTARTYRVLPSDLEPA